MASLLERLASPEFMVPEVRQFAEAAKPQKGVIRRALCAPPGKTLVVVDSGQIEARVTAWLAGHEELLEVFADPKRDVYGEQGSKYFGRTITKKTDPEARQVSKCMVLGLGFGMGWYKFSGELLKGMMGAPPVQFTEADAEKLVVDLNGFAQDPGALTEEELKEMGEHNRSAALRRMMNWRRVEGMPSRLPFGERFVHCAVAHEFVGRYRRANKSITELWKTMEQVLEVMVDLEEQPEGTFIPFGPNDCMRIVRHGIRLPNGLVMRYPGLRHSDGGEGEGFSYMGGKVGKERVRAYGGSVTENVVQALARIIVAEQMLRARYVDGYHVTSMTHDEVVLCVDEAEAPRALERTLELMKTAPAWAAGLPLNAEGDAAISYGAAK